MRLELEESWVLEMYFFFFQVFLTGIILYILIGRIFKIWKEYRLLKTEKSKAELSNLRNQISPHFFFNTLNNLYGLIAKDTVAAREFVLKLSELMRYSIYTGSNDKVNIMEEVDYLKSFIDLQEIRYHKEMNISFHTEIQNDQFEIPPLLLIVLLENAFKHGVEKMAEDVMASAKLMTNDKSLVFEVKNKYIRDTTTEPGIGLKNLRQRLKLRYPKKHRLEIKDSDGLFQARLEIKQ